ncbi:hypothetical protein AC579_7784 [Pseudocercospora musae]|uniref:Uncharacterized protein n=1 Tax=Pseudocercospora musae TaxID=113226 RepID=A0A139IJM7_9PEZI|nr:hypothetical protein AC579_7784 [Pseudocercospora musae]
MFGKKAREAAGKERDAPPVTGVVLKKGCSRLLKGEYHTSSDLSASQRILPLHTHTLFVSPPLPSSHRYTHVAATPRHARRPSQRKATQRKATQRKATQRFPLACLTSESPQRDLGQCIC